MCSEAMYNLGLANKQLGNLEDAIDCFQKLHVIISNHPEVIYQIALLNEMIGDLEQAIEWYLLKYYKFTLHKNNNLNIKKT